MNLHDIFINTISQGLQRKAIQVCSKWACEYRIMGAPYPGKWSFKYHPWLKEMHDSQADLNIGQKAAQMGFTETMLNLALYTIDIRRENVMYVLPSKLPDAADFSSSRFDVALELSDHLDSLFTETKNIGHKRAGSANLYIRGSKSRAGLKSVPAPLLIFDEVDEMTQKNIPLAFERSSGQPIKKAWMLSTPTSDDIGINEYYKNSTQEFFTFKCPHCSRFTKLDFPDCLVIIGEDILDPRLKETHIICTLCKHKLTHRDKHEFLKDGVWVPNFKQRESRGFGISQLYSSTIAPYEFAISYFKSKLSPADEQEFYNSKLGLTCTPEGSRITDTHIQEVISTHKMGSETSGDNIITMGADIGKKIHVWVDRWYIDSSIQSVDLNVRAFAKSIGIFSVDQFEDLDEIFDHFKCHFAVIDANPERRKAFEFAMRHPGRVRLCFYARGVHGKQINLSKDTGENEPTVSVERTSWLDLSLGRFFNKKIALPQDTPTECKDHLKAMVRRYKRDAEGNVTSTYVKNVNAPDHYAHARNYSEIAFPLALDGLGFQVQNIVKAP